MNTADLFDLEPEAEARVLVQIIAGPMRLGENVKSALTRVARATGLGDRRVRGIWNSEARSIQAGEMDRLRRAALDARARDEARDEYRKVVASLTRGETALRLRHQDQGGDVDAAGVEVARRSRCSVGGGASR